MEEWSDEEDDEEAVGSFLSAALESDADRRWLDPRRVIDVDEEGACREWEEWLRDCGREAEGVCNERGGCSAP